MILFYLWVVRPVIVLKVIDKTTALFISYRSGDKAFLDIWLWYCKTTWQITILFNA
jgi:hypothetical protein